jgi:hypothetical protein
MNKGRPGNRAGTRSASVAAASTVVPSFAVASTFTVPPSRFNSGGSRPGTRGFQASIGRIPYSARRKSSAGYTLSLIHTSQALPSEPEDVEGDEGENEEGGSGDIDGEEEEEDQPIKDLHTIIKERIIHRRETMDVNREEDEDENENGDAIDDFEGLYTKGQ